ncbi:C-X-C motif chemokine 2 [Plecturocebus cupreus]
MGVTANPICHPSNRNLSYREKEISREFRKPQYFRGKNEIMRRYVQRGGPTDLLGIWGRKRISQSPRAHGRYSGGPAREAHRWVTSHRPPPTTAEAGPDPSFRTRDRPGAPRVFLARGFQTFQPQSCIKRVRPSQGATEPGLQAPPRLLSHSWHRRPTRLLSPTAPGSPRPPPAPAGGVAAPGPGCAAGRRATGESRRTGGPGAGRGWGGLPAPTAPLTQRISSSLGQSVANELRCQRLQILQRTHRQEQVKCEPQVPGIPPRPNRSPISPAPRSRCQRWGPRPSRRPHPVWNPTSCLSGSPSLCRPTLKNGQKACLNPASPMVQKIIQKMLSR